MFTVGFTVLMHWQGSDGEGYSFGSVYSFTDFSPCALGVSRYGVLRILSVLSPHASNMMLHSRSVCEPRE